jgi:hypothetical protein
MGAKGVRATVASALGPAVTASGLRVVGYADDVKPEPLHPVAVLWVEGVGPTEVMTSAALLYRVKLLLAVAKVEPGTADDDLDDLLDDVRACLDDTDQLLWTVAQRGTYLEAFPSYTFDLEVRS